MIWIARLLLFAVVGLVAAVVLTAGFAVGLAGIAVLGLTGSTGLVTLGARTMRSVERLPLPPIGRPEAFVYLLQDERAATKIGISGDPHARLATLQTGHPDQLALIKAIGCSTTVTARTIERDLHEFFARYRMNGEWFDLSERQVRLAIRLARRWRSSRSLP